MAKNFWGYPDCGNMINYSPIESSGAISLGTSAGTDRSISYEFNTNHPTPSTPHSISEYQGGANMEVATRYRDYPYGSWSNWNVATDLESWAANSDEYTTVCDVFSSGSYQYKQLEYCISSCFHNSRYLTDKEDPTSFSDYYGRGYCCYIDTRICVAAVNELQACYDKNWNSVGVNWQVGQSLHNTNKLNWWFYVMPNNNSGNYFCTQTRWQVGIYGHSGCRIKCSVHHWC